MIDVSNSLFAQDDLVPKENNAPGDPALKHHANPAATHPKHRLAPTWSWASVQGSIVASRPSREGSLVNICPMNIRDGITCVEPAALVISGDLHVALLNDQQTRQETLGTDAVKYFPDCKEEWGPRMWAKEPIAPAAAYPDTTPPKDAMMIFGLPIMRRKRTKALQREEFRTDIDKISGLIVVPAPVGLQGIYWRIGCFDMLPDRSELKLGEEFCYREENKRLFSEGPGGYTEMVLLN